MDLVTLAQFVLFGCAIIVAEVIALHLVFKRNLEGAIDRAAGLIQVKMEELKSTNSIEVALDTAIDRAVDRAVEKAEAMLSDDEKMDELTSRFISTASSNEQLMELGARGISAFGAAMSAHARASRAGSAPRRSNDSQPTIFGALATLLPGKVGAMARTAQDSGLDMSQLAAWAAQNPQLAQQMLQAAVGGGSPPPTGYNAGTGVPWGK